MSNTDNFIKASTNGQTPVAATLTNTHTQGSEAFECDNLTGWADTAAFIVYETDSNRNPIPGSETSWVAEKNNKILQNAVLTSGTDRDYPASKTMVVADYTAEAHNRLVTALLKTHNQDGTLKDIDGFKLKDNSIDGSKLKDNSIDGSKLKSSSVKPEHTNFPIACYSNETSGAQHSSGAIIRLRSKIHSNTTDIELQADSSFKIKKSGLLKLSFNIWIHGAVNSRPWLNINRRRGSQHEVVADVIDDSSSSYVSLNLSNFIIPVQSDDIISITCGVGDGVFYVDGNSGRANSQVVLELL